MSSNDVESTRIMAKQAFDYCLIVLAIACLFLYCFTSVPREQMYELITPLDYLIPLIPLFVIPYASFHFLMMPATLAILYLQPTAYYLRVFLVSAIMLLLVSNLIFILFPTCFVLRPAITHSSLLYQFIRFIYRFDNPYALFPSIHVSVTVLCALMWWRVRSRFTWFMIPWSLLIVCSTLFVRQHYVLDVVAGIIAGCLMYHLGHYLTNKFFFPDMRM